MTHMLFHLGDQDPLNQLRLEYELNRLLYTAFTAFPPIQRSQISDDKKNQADEALIKKIILYIEENYKEKITLKDLGKLCSYNLSYLSLFFKKHMGINFYEYLMRIRLREATLELCSENYNILDIASRNGFADLKSFNSNFKKVFNKSPREYRHQLLEENKGMNFSEKRKFVSLEDEGTLLKLNSYLDAYRTLFPAGRESQERSHITDRLEELQGISLNLYKQIEDLKSRL